MAHSNSPTKKSERLIQALMIIQSRDSVKAKEIADILDIDIRSVYRYIKDLRKMGFQIESSTGAEGGFIPRGELALQSMTFSGLEAMALLMASKALGKDEGLPLKNDLDNALNKVIKAIDSEGVDYVKILSPKISILIDHMKNYFPWEKTFTAINESMLRQKTLSISYYSYSGGKSSVREINPHHVFFRDGVWYIVAYCKTRCEERTFRLDRIQGARITDEPFNSPADFDINKYFANSWRLARGERVTVKIKFYPPVTHLISESEWHSSQVIEENDDGTLFYTVIVEGTWEIKKWVLGWGKYAEVVEPPDLREDIQEELAAMSGLYRDDN